MSGYKSSQPKHVVSHPQQLYMILNNCNEDLNVRLRIRLEDFDYVQFVSEHMKSANQNIVSLLTKKNPAPAEEEGWMRPAGGESLIYESMAFCSGSDKEYRIS